jgi:hypothetical protein
VRVVAELSVSREQVERVMCIVLGSSRAHLNSWELEQLPYLSILQGRALARLAGSATLEAGENARWSAVVKVITPPLNPEGSHPTKRILRQCGKPTRAPLTQSLRACLRRDPS